MEKGALVYLKSGSVAMTVTGVDDKTLSVHWYDGGALQGVALPIEAFTETDPRPVIKQSELAIEAAVTAKPPVITDPPLIAPAPVVNP